MIRIRLVLAVAGLAAALLAVSTGDRRVGWVAIALLLVYVIVRLVQRNSAGGHQNRGPEDGERL